MPAPVWRLKKSEIVWLAKHTCKAHGVAYLDHYNCYLRENPLAEKVGFFDIETSNLQADFGIMLCYCIKEAGKNKIYHRVITKEDLNKHLDKAVVEQCIEDLKKFDRVITFYGKHFDVPFTRSRALYWGLDFPEYGQLHHDDIYFIIRNRFRIHRNRLEDACRLVLGKTRKTHLDATHWIKALQGDEKALKYILDHCKKDVRDLEDLYNKVINFARPQNASI